MNRRAVVYGLLAVYLLWGRSGNALASRIEHQVTPENIGQQWLELRVAMEASAEGLIQFDVIVNSASHEMSRCVFGVLNV